MKAQVAEARIDLGHTELRLRFRRELVGLDWIYRAEAWGRVFVAEDFEGLMAQVVRDLGRPIRVRLADLEWREVEP